jgi:hypothetical protein
MSHERQTPFTERRNRRCRFGLSCDYQKGASHIIDAVAEFTSGSGALGVFEYASVVAQPQQMIEGQRWRAHATAAARASTTSSARVR